MRAFIIAAAAVLNFALSCHAFAQQPLRAVTTPDEWEVRRSSRNDCAVILFLWTPDRTHFRRPEITWHGSCGGDGLATGAGNINLLLGYDGASYEQRNSGLQARYGMLTGVAQVGYDSGEVEPQPSIYDRSCQTGVNSGQRIYLFHCDPSRAEALSSAVLAVGGANAFFQRAFDPTVTGATIVDADGQCRLSQVEAVARYYGEYTVFANRYPSAFPHLENRSGLGRVIMQARHFQLYHALELADAYAPCTGNALTLLRAWLVDQIQVYGYSCDWRTSSVGPCPAAYPNR